MRKHMCSAEDFTDWQLNSNFGGTSHDGRIGAQWLPSYAVSYGHASRAEPATRCQDQCQRLALAGQVFDAGLPFA